MTERTVLFKILRFKPGVIDPPCFQTFALTVKPNMRVLDCLEQIRITQDNSLMYRHSCHHACCGSCACKINGKARLACTTLVADLDNDSVTLEPLDHFEVKGDLVIDMRSFFKSFSGSWRYLRPSEKSPHLERLNGVKRFMRFEDCIECGACVSACPMMHSASDFMGPAALAAISTEFAKNASKKLLSLAGGERGERWCRRALACSRVCPTGVYPAKHIADLRRLLHPDLDEE
jgi:succinate dehydrogenase / fumarate reductase iron-sulfur subunit